MMKMMDKMNAFMFFVIISCLIGFIVYNTIKSETLNNTSIVEIAGTEQKLPLRLNKNYEVISAKMEDDNLIIVIKDRFTGSEYQSSFPYDELKRKICGGYVYRKSYWNCSDDEKMIKSIILELGYKSLKLL